MKRIKAYKGFIIKEATLRDKKDGFNYNYGIFNKENDIIWECDNIKEAIEFIDSY